MSLKRRNTIACILILLASLCWAFGQWTLNADAATGFGAAETTFATSIAATAETFNGIIVTESTFTVPGTEPGVDMSGRNENHRGSKLLGYILCFTAVGMAGTAVFAFSQCDPFFGPDGICLLFASVAALNAVPLNIEYIMWSSTVYTLRITFLTVAAFLVLLGIRESYGWMRAGFYLSWCLVQRTTKRCTTPQMSLLIFVGWIVLSLIGVGYIITANGLYEGTLFGILGYSAAAAFGFLGLWKYGTDLNHFKKQLDNYQHGKPITVGDGAFSQTEAQLLDVQAQHEEAVRTAVTSERFKVELISNVSHDLRTPLTSILGYSELLQNEALSPEGQEQLRRLHQKAGYMNDLVESLFELTKVSSGVVESKKDQIDLVRLLEQTIGLFDDQLVSAGLVVKRSYCADTIPAITDGARMHQVFANLLGNAIKYAMVGTRIYVEVKETESSYQIRMMNTASYEMDFKPDEIMQRFARGDKARSTKGSGLGLAIAQTYTESVGGSFRVGVDGDQFSAIVELPKTERNL